MLVIMCVLGNLEGIEYNGMLSNKIALGLALSQDVALLIAG